MKSRLIGISTALFAGVLTATSVIPPAVAQNSTAGEILNAHNRYRSEVGVPPLTWSNTLASQAQQWATHLASIGTLQHSSSAQRPNQGENLWGGTSRSFSFTQMVDTWGNEKQYFVRGTFPNVSNTGNWSQVGHYTQVIWRNTREVGCGGVDAGGKFFLVCRYSGPGNIQGQPVP